MVTILGKPKGQLKLLRTRRKQTRTHLEQAWHLFYFDVVKKRKAQANPLNGLQSLLQRLKLLQLRRIQLLVKKMIRFNVPQQTRMQLLKTHRSCWVVHTRSKASDTTWMFWTQVQLNNATQTCKRKSLFMTIPWRWIIATSLAIPGASPKELVWINGSQNLTHISWD